MKLQCVTDTEKEMMVDAINVTIFFVSSQSSAPAESNEIATST